MSGVFLTKSTMVASTSINVKAGKLLKDQHKIFLLMAHNFINIHIYEFDKVSVINNYVFYPTSVYCAEH